MTSGGGFPERGGEAGELVREVLPWAVQQLYLIL